MASSTPPTYVVLLLRVGRGGQRRVGQRTHVPYHHFRHHRQTQGGSDAAPRRRLLLLRARRPLPLPGQRGGGREPVLHLGGAPPAALQAGRRAHGVPVGLSGARPPGAGAGAARPQGHSHHAHALAAGQYLGQPGAGLEPAAAHAAGRVPPGGDGALGAVRALRPPHASGRAADQRLQHVGVHRCGVRDGGGGRGRPRATVLAGGSRGGDHERGRVPGTVHADGPGGAAGRGG
mmetsp:Transcript_4073/g.9877  ORF Transcript_4073/g.9877 Transcript_4073/m.9877 type:complete len:233 (+) Transcript_4073:297-995(+)